jgi:hypothetical protein
MQFTYTIPDIYVQKLLEEIEASKEKGLKTVYRINDRMLKEVANYTKLFFSDKPEYNFEMKPCARCTNKWDVIITWNN